MTRATKSRTFEYVVFYDQVAWVAGATDYYAVQQGRTPDEAVDSLKYCLQVEAEWAELEDQVPFSREDMQAKDVPEEFRATDEACTHEYGMWDGEDREKSYTGTLTVEWRVPTETDKKNDRADRKRRGFHVEPKKKKGKK